MLEAMATLILVIVGAVLLIFVLGYGIYITFYPLTKTVKGGIDAMKEYVEEEEGKKGAEKEGTSTPTGGARPGHKTGQRGAQHRKKTTKQ